LAEGLQEGVLTVDEQLRADHRLAHAPLLLQRWACQHKQYVSHA
jgi:hypothetical protein